MANGKKVQMDILMAAKGMMLWTKQQHGRNTSMSGEWTAIGLQSHYLSSCGSPFMKVFMVLLEAAPCHKFGDF